ncbi:hypothetical protein NCCP28_38570 [Niallia sp. NCCP-28]|nr:hypothetical protein NCCP28_38570 [Niallia sp. NCCP-28]
MIKSAVKKGLPIRWLLPYIGSPLFDYVTANFVLLIGVEGISEAPSESKRL